jgi:hypothetical protein
MSVRSLSRSETDKAVQKSRAYAFNIPLDPDSYGDDLSKAADWTPDPCPELFHNTYACGYVSAQAYGAETLVVFRGYAEFRSQISVGQITAWLGSKVALTPVQIKDRDTYITNIRNAKDKVDSDDLISNAWEVGSQARLSEQGKRNDFFEIRDILKKNGPIEGRKIIAESFPGHFMRFAGGIERLANILQPTLADSDFIPRIWQEAIIRVVQKPAHNRWIWWIYDDKGGMGKSRLTTHLCSEYNAIELSGRFQDIAHGYNSQPIVIFDIPRAEKLELLLDLYKAAEAFKNGSIFSPKYESCLKRFKVPHVFFFSNQPAPAGVWSADRLQFIQLSTPPGFSPTSVPIDPSIEEDNGPTGVALYQQLSAEIKARREEERKAKHDREDGVEILLS